MGPKGGGALRNGGPKEWGPEGGGGPRRVGPFRRVGGPKLSRYFPSPTNIRSCFLSLGGFSWNCGHGSRPWTTQFVRLGLGSFVRAPAPYRPPGFHKIAQTRNLGGPRPRPVATIPQEYPPREKTRAKMERERENAKFWAVR